MKVIIYGASGMVGSGVLRECQLDAEVEQILSVGRSPTSFTSPKVRHLEMKDLTDYAAVRDQLKGYDACFFCLGVSSVGMSEEAYSRVTYDFTMAAAQTLVQLNPGMVFVFVSGASTDNSERGKVMWARVKGKAENAVAKLPFKASYMFRPGFIQPVNGARSKTTAYRILYMLLTPLTPLLRALFPHYVTDTQKIGQAMLIVAKHGAPKKIFSNADINDLVSQAAL